MSGYRKYKSNIGTYNMSSSAYAYDYYEEDERYFEKKREREEQLRALALRKEQRIHRVKLAVSVIFVFGGCLAVMISHAAVVKQRVINVKLTEKSIQLQGENHALQAELSNKVDLAYIEEEAITRLGMSEPQEYQLRYIDVPKQSYTVQYGVDEKNDKDFSLSSIVGLFGKK